MKGLKLKNAEAADYSELPLFEIQVFRRAVIEAALGGARLASFFAFPEDGAFRLVAVLAREEEGFFELLSTRVSGGYPSLAPELPAAHYFEREIAEQWALSPRGHPWLKPVRWHKARVESGNYPFPQENIKPACGNFFKFGGHEAHEVAVGPVHAGIIEPGHFRFQCHGENIFHLEIALGFQHRGIEKALVGGTAGRAIHYIETAAGDTTAAHTAAYCQCLEALAGTRPGKKTEFLRSLAIELERLANHTGDLGALAGDVGYLPVASYCGRLRGDFLNLTAAVCGNRFSRRWLRPGGTLADIAPQMVPGLLNRLESAEKDLTGALRLLWGSSTVAARFEETGALSPENCRELGLSGVAARACGISRDARADFPHAAYRFFKIEPATDPGGDVYARVRVRALEIERSTAYLKTLLTALPSEAASKTEISPAAGKIAVSVAEGWRGPVFHTGMTGADGKFLVYKIVDPSFNNWTGLAFALREQQVSDFPLINKSFNLSYCGHDL